MRERDRCESEIDGYVTNGTGGEKLLRFTREGGLKVADERIGR